MLLLFQKRRSGATGIWGRDVAIGLPTMSLGLRPIVSIELSSVMINLTGSGSSGNPYTLTVK